MLIVYTRISYDKDQRFPFKAPWLTVTSFQPYHLYLAGDNLRCYFHLCEEQLQIYPYIEPVSSNSSGLRQWATYWKFSIAALFWKNRHGPIFHKRMGATVMHILEQVMKRHALWGETVKKYLLFMLVCALSRRKGSAPHQAVVRLSSHQTSRASPGSNEDA